MTSASNDEATRAASKRNLDKISHKIDPRTSLSTLCALYNTNHEALFDYPSLPTFLCLLSSRKRGEQGRCGELI
jgi:hypothetical protein